MSSASRASTQKLIEALWQRNQAQVLERLDLLDHFASAAANQTLNPALQDEATSVAHKLAGSLGMFGFHEGTQLARELEQHIESPHLDPTRLRVLASQLRGSLFPIKPDEPASGSQDARTTNPPAAHSQQTEEQAMVDVDLFVEQLRKRGHTVDSVIPVPQNAGDYEFSVDGNMLSLAEARLLLEEDETH